MADFDIVGAAVDKVCEFCERAIKGSNWARHLKTKMHLKYKGKPMQCVLVKGKVDLKKGRPKSGKYHTLDVPSVWQHIRHRGIELYHHKPNLHIQSNL